MKKITLTESDLLKIVKRVLNERELKQFNEDEIDILYHIFERELKPPFRKGDKELHDLYPYYNRDGKRIGWLNSEKRFSIIYDPFWVNIRDKVCQVFEFPRHTWDWRNAIYPHLKSWLEDHLNMKLT